MVKLSATLLICFGCVSTHALANPNQHDAAKTKSTSQTTNDRASTGYDPSIPAVTIANVRYGDHSRHTLDFWKAESDEPTPLVFVIHGGGWRGGSSQQKLHKLVDTARLLENGISVVSIHYRLMKHAQDVQPPVKAPLEDAAMALQFVRSKSADWNIDKTRIGAAGGSAGACSCLWIGYHKDLADPNSAAPVARESSRPNFLAVTRPQTTLDPVQMKEWIANSTYGAHAFNLNDFEAFIAARDKILPWIREYSPYELLTSDDPPTYMIFTVAPSENRVEKDPTHSAIFGVKLKERCDELGVQCEVCYPGAPNVQHKSPTEYLINKLQSPEK
ncbi:acetyl esterase [Planctomycetes bacterium CA13]|uniref:Acetyl esterase n=1 Tax=Novipirellula herctigrandis TaxID=2527986 RepID=A0A5C5Z405_9BACT|nr:acetyl esterase [Planctomycetes bacterium CA13]